MRTKIIITSFLEKSKALRHSVSAVFILSLFLGGGFGWLVDQQYEKRQAAQAMVQAAAAGDISTVAGNGTGGFSGDGAAATSAQIDAPNGVFVDGVGNLYIADYFNNRVRKVTRSTGFISTIAGTGVAGSLGDGGLATSAQVNGPTTVITDNAGNVYIGESGGHRVRKINTSGIISTFAGTGVGGYTGDGGLATAAQLNNPADIAFDAAENLYIAQYNNNVVRKVNAATGIITTVAGNGSSGSTGDGGPATSATMAGVIGVDVDAAGNIYIVNLNNYRVRKVDVSTGFISTVVGTGTSGFSGDGGLATSATIGDTYDVSVDSIGNFYISDRSNGRIRKITVSTGVITTVAGNGSGSYCCDGGPALSAGINPVGIFVDPAGNLFIGDNTSDRVRKVEAATVALPPFNFAFGSFGAGNGQFSGPEDIVTDTSGNIYVADTNNHRIQKFTSAGVFIAAWGTQGTGNGQFQYPDGLAIDSSNNIYVADSNNSRVQKFTSAGVFILKWGRNGGDGTSGSGDGEFSYTADIDIDNVGNVYVADFLNSRVQKFTSTGTFISKFTVSGVVDLAVDSNNDIYTVNFNEFVVRKFNNAGTALLTWGSSGTGNGQLNGAIGVDVDSVDYVYVADRNNNRIQKFDYLGNFVGKAGVNGGDGTSGSGNGEFNNPRGLYVDSNGVVYVADNGNQRVQVFVPQPFAVSSVTPTKNANAISAAANVVLVFNASLSTGTVTSSTLRVTGSRSGQIAGVISFSTTTGANDTVTFNPTNNFKSGETINVTVTTGVQSTEPAALTAAHVSQFTVDASAGTGIYTTQRYVLPGVSSSEPYHNCSGDFNADGDIDLAVSFFALNRIAVYTNDGTGLFSAPVQYASTSNGPYQLHCSDVSGDGNVDILFPNFNGSNIGVLISNGDDTFAAAAFYSAGASQPLFLTSGDFDGDGDLDIAHAQQSATSFRVLLNAGAGTFGAATAVSTGVGNENRAVAAGDFNNDGRVDITVITAAVAGTPQVLLFWGNGDGTFNTGPAYTLTGTANQGQHIVAGNLNGDAYLDILAVHQNNDTHVLLNNGNETFASPVVYNPFAGGACQTGALADIDSDNDLDMLVTCSGGTGVGIAKNNGSGVFSFYTTVEMAVDSTFSVGAADLNNDGAVDVWLTNTNSPQNIFIRFNDTLAPQTSVFQPNGGETAIIGSSYNIIWRAFDNSADNSTVDVEFTIDNLAYNPVPGGSGLVNESAHPYLAQWGTGGAGTGQFDQPWGMDVDQVGNIYVVDSLNHRVQKFTNAGVFISAFGSLGTGNGQFNTPRDIAIDSVGNIYVTDSGNNRVQKFTSAGVYVSQFGVAGTGLTQFNAPWGIDLDRSDQILVVDSGNHRVQRCFNVSCNLQWGTFGTGNGQFSTPRMLAVSPVTTTQDRVFVVDEGNHRVQNFQTNGGFVQAWGTNGTGAGQFSLPQGIEADPATNLFVSDSNGRVQKFTNAGVFVSEFGTTGSGNGQFNAAVALAIDSFSRIYIADSTNDRVQSFTRGGSLAWTVPNSPTALARIRVTATDIGGLTTQDLGDAVFTIGVGGGTSNQRIQQANTPVAPTAQSGVATSSNTVRWAFIDNAANELGFRLYDGDDNVLVDIGLPDQNFIEEDGLEANAEFSGRAVTAYNNSGESASSNPFQPVVTLMPDLLAAVEGTTSNTLTVGVPAPVPNLTAGNSGLLFELLSVSGGAQASAMVSSGWVQTSSHTFTGLDSGIEYRARVKARNQASVESDWSPYAEPVTVGEVPPAGAPQFSLDLTLSQSGAPVMQGERLNPLQSVQGTITVKNIGTVAATNVLVNMLIPRYMFLSEQSLRVNGAVHSAAADTDAAQGNGNAVSAIWDIVEPQRQYTVSFTLFFDIEALRALLAETSASANPLLQLQASLSAAELSAPVFTSILTIEPDLVLLVPSITPEPSPEPTPPSPEVVETIENVLQDTFPTPGEPTFEPIPQGETTTTYQNGSFTLETTDGLQTLTVEGVGQSGDGRLEFMGTTSQPFTLVTLIFNGSVSTVVVSDANGTWRTLVSAAELGIGEGESAQVTIEAIAAKGDLRSERVQIANILVSRARSGQVVAEFDTRLSPDAFVRAVDQVVGVLRENEEGLRATLAVSAPVIIVSSVPLWGYLPYIPTLFYHLIGWVLGAGIRRKKRDQASFGVVYDAITKLPLSLAIIRVYDAANKLVATQVTDKQGRYDALLPSGTFIIKVTKPAYHYPSSIVTTSVDGDYQRVYNKQTGITISGTSVALPHIPLDPINDKRRWELSSVFKKGWLAFQRLGDIIATPILAVGLVTAIALVAVNPDRDANWLVAGLYIVTVISQWKLKPKIIKAWGVVYDIATNAVLPLTTIQLIDPQYGKVVTSRLSDYEGRFSFLPEPGSYVIKATHAGYEQVEVVETPSSERQTIPNKIVIQKPNQTIMGDLAMRAAST